MKVLLVGNYKADGQWSMDRFGNMLLRGLRELGIETYMVRPAVVLGGGNKWLGYVDKLVLFWFALRREVKARPGWVVHIVDQGNGVWAGWLGGGMRLKGPMGPIGPMRCVVTCHDLLAIRAARGEFPGARTGWTGRIFQRMILRGLRKAGRLVCASEATRKDAERLIGAGAVIANGLEDFWRQTDADEAWGHIEKAGVSARAAGYVLHVGGETWYKNRAGVVRLFVELRKSTNHAPKLVMAGPKLDPARLAELQEAGLESEVTVMKAVPDETLRALYGMARVLVLPSLAEGFGWPILEAQACGCPVVTTNAQPMRETGGDAAIYADHGEWANAVAQVLEMDEARRAALVAAGLENARRYTVKKMAREYAELYQRGPE
jgi:glycosyltransferase involved in cell wall biosynthesis